MSTLDDRQARLLLAILRDDADDAAALAGAAAAPHGAAFVELCRRCDVPTWVHERLTADDAPCRLDDEVIEPLAAIRHRTRRDNLLLMARAEQALEALADAGVRPVALKGLDALYRLYDHFDTRLLDDVDLLVRDDELRPALEALERAGWEVPPEPIRTAAIRASHHLPMRSPPPVHVDFELHWSLAQRGRFPIDVDALCDRARPLEVGRARAWRLEDHDLVAHLLLHHFTHYFDRRLKWAVDLGLVVGRDGFDWSLVAERVRDWGAGAASAASVRHLRALFPDRVPRSITEQLPLAAWRRMLLAPLATSDPLDHYRGTRSRNVQLWLAAVLLERPSDLPGWIRHRMRRGGEASGNPLDPSATATDDSLERE